MPTNHRVYLSVCAVLLMVGGSLGSAAEPADVPRPIDTVPLEVLDKEIPHQAGAEWPNGPMTW